ncbi:MAG: hypothetical protein HC915_07505 [Anaerolineae bacterium]|nr:hypothetical protein [Anaerolineae bacterium]
MEDAHAGLVARPTEDPVASCGSCHPNITEHAVDSLHFTLRGYDTAIYARSAPEHFPALEEMETYHCNDCHASCGDCHVSQPNSVGGGLVQGHVFYREPSMSQNCTACHGSRVKDEYYGAHEGIPSDVHFRARMACIDCHTGDVMHGVNVEADHRYDGTREPTCEDCHTAQVGAGSGILQHEIHGTESLSCQACHSVEYTNCTNCHVQRTEDDIPFFSVESHSLGFYLGRNPLRSAERPYEYVPLRHVPIDPDSFSFYGENLLPNFSALPTWVHATPHNIQRNTPQTESCLSCHGNDAIFLTPDKVEPNVLEANLGVIVPAAPPLPEGYEDVITRPEAATPASEGGGDDFWGGEGESSAPATESEPAAPAAEGDSFWGGDGESEGSAAPASDATSGTDASSPTPEATPAEDAESFWGN